MQHLCMTKHYTVDRHFLAGHSNPWILEPLNPLEQHCVIERDPIYFASINYN